jgi:hypothetical protein
MRHRISLTTPAIAFVALAFSCSKPNDVAVIGDSQQRAEAPSGAQEPSKYGDNLDPSLGKESWNSHEVRRDNFSLTLEWPRSVTQGESSPVRIGIAPIDPWHVNMEYPMSLEIDPNPLFSLPKNQLTSSDAAHHAESGSGFELALTPSQSGKTSLHARLKFAVCAATECLPVTMPITVDLDIDAV